MKKNIVKINDIRKSLFNSYLDSEYGEALAEVMMRLGYVNKSPLSLYCGTEEEQESLKVIETTPLTSNQISEIIHLMMYKMRDDFQYGIFKPIAIKYINISEEMRKNSNENKTTNQNIKPQGYLGDVSGCMFDTICEASKILKRNNMHDESRQMVERATTSYSYDDAYKIIEEYIDIIKVRALEEEEEFE